MQDLYGERTEYQGDHLVESTAPADPFVLFDAWLADAFAARERGALPEPTAAELAALSELKMGPTTEESLRQLEHEARSGRLG